MDCIATNSTELTSTSPNSNRPQVNSTQHDSTRHNPMLHNSTQHNSLSITRLSISQFGITQITIIELSITHMSMYFILYMFHAGAGDMVWQEEIFARKGIQSNGVVWYGLSLSLTQHHLLSHPPDFPLPTTVGCMEWGDAAQESN